MARPNHSLAARTQLWQSSACNFPSLFNSMHRSQDSTDISLPRPNKPKNGGITAGISRAGAGRDGRDAAIGTLNGADSGAEVSQVKA